VTERSGGGRAIQCREKTISCREIAARQETNKVESQDVQIDEQAKWGKVIRKLAGDKGGRQPLRVKEKGGLTPVNEFFGARARRNREQKKKRYVGKGGQSQSELAGILGRTGK